MFGGPIDPKFREAFTRGLQTRTQALRGGSQAEVSRVTLDPVYAQPMVITLAPLIDQDAQGHQLGPSPFVPRPVDLAHALITVGAGKGASYSFEVDWPARGQVIAVYGAFVSVIAVFTAVAGGSNFPQPFSASIVPGVRNSTCFRTADYGQIVAAGIVELPVPRFTRRVWYSFTEGGSLGNWGLFVILARSVSGGPAVWSTQGSLMSWVVEGFRIPVGTNYIAINNQSGVNFTNVRATCELEI